MPERITLVPLVPFPESAELEVRCQVSAHPAHVIKMNKETEIIICRSCGDPLPDGKRVAEELLKKIRDALVELERWQWQVSLRILETSEGHPVADRPREIHETVVAR